MKYRSRKFLIAAFVEVAATVALFTEFLTGAEWVSASSLVLGLYGMADVADQKLNGAEK